MSAHEHFLVIWGSKCHQNNSPVVCDGCVKYEEAEVDRLVAILKTNNCGGGLWNTVSSPPRRGLLKYMSGVWVSARHPAAVTVNAIISDGKRQEVVENYQIQ